MRWFLNHTFFKKAFTKDEKKGVNKVKLENFEIGEVMDFCDYGGHGEIAINEERSEKNDDDEDNVRIRRRKSTKDKVFLISLWDSNYLKTLYKKFSDYSIAKKINSSGIWWWRTAYSFYPNYAYNALGTFYQSQVDNKSYGVVPAMIIPVKKFRKIVENNKNNKR